jgi:hypothetical protein
MKAQRIGGIAALVEALSFVFGFAMAATVLADYTPATPTPARRRPSSPTTRRRCPSGTWSS